MEAEAEGLFHPAVEQGVELPPGALIGWLLEAGEEVPAAVALRRRPASPQAAPEAEAAVAAEPAGPGTHRLAPVGLFVSPNARRVARERGVDVDPAAAAPARTGASSPPTCSRLREPAAAAPAAGRPSVVSPLVRRDAAAAGVDLGSVPASGPGGKIRRADVIAAAAPAGAAPSRARRRRSSR